MLAFRAPGLTIAAVLIALAYGITFPLISSRLEATGVNGTLIGINAAMPPLGWVIGSLAVPLLQIRLGMPFKHMLQLFVVVAIGALAAMLFAETYASMTGLRLLFGGSMGILFRCIEYWINDASPSDLRGRNISVYSVLFMVALIIGSIVQPQLGTQGWVAFAPPLVMTGVGLVVLQLWNGRPTAIVDVVIPPATVAIVSSVPIAFLAVLVYGVFEAAPTTMLQVYALRNGLEGTTAAYALSAAALGNLVFQYPIASLSDRIGRTVPLLVCATTAAVVSAATPWTLGRPSFFLAAVAILGAAAGSTYSMGLAMIGDVFKGARLIVANAAFGVVYAIGSIAGPLIDGVAIDQLQTHGLMLSVASTFSLLVGVIAWGLFRPQR